MTGAVRVGIIGDLDPDRPSHKVTNEALEHAAGALRPGGTLLLLDLYKAKNPSDYLMGAVGFPATKVIRLAKTGSLSVREPPELRRAWEEHGATDRFPTVPEVREACSGVGLIGAKVRRHLLWRYSVVWRKPVR